MSIADEYEAKLKRVKEFRDVERGIDIAERALRHPSIIFAIKGMDDAEGDRSIEHMALTQEESAAVYQVVVDVLRKRQATLEEEMKAAV